MTCSDLCSRILRLAVLGAWCGVLAQAASGADKTGVEGLLLHASFDGDGYESLEPRMRRMKARIMPVPGKRGHYPIADWAVGSPLPLNVCLVEFDKNGRFGGAVRVPTNNGVLTFDADGNLLTRRGTLAVWARPDAPLWSTYYRDGRHPSVINIRDLQNALRVAPFMRIGINSRKKLLYLLTVDALREGMGHHGWEQLEKGNRLEWRPGAQWPAGSWGHLAVVWDAARGRKWYFNGNLIAEKWGALPEHRPPCLDQVSLGCNAGPGHIRGQDLGFSFDELYIFDYMLNEQQIHRLIQENKPPQHRNAPDQGIGAAVERWVRDHYGLDQPRESLDAKAIPEYRDGVLEIRHVPIADVRELKTETRMAADGKTNTVWPLEYKSPSTAEGRKLVLQFEPGARFNLVRICGTIQGKLTADGRPIARFLGDAFIQRARLERPVAAKVAQFQHEFGRINEVAFFHVQRHADLALNPPGRELALAAGRPDAAGELKRAIQAYCLPEDRTTLVMTGRGAKTSTISIEPYRAYQCVTEPVAADTRIGTLLLELHLQGFDSPTHLMIQVHDPVTLARDLLVFEVRLMPAGAGPRKVALLFNGPAVMLEKGRRLWLTLLFDRRGGILCGPGRSRIVLSDASEGQQKTYMTAMRRILCDQFLQLSEPQAWNASPGEDPAKQYKGVNILLTTAEHMLRLDPGNRAAASILSWVLRWRGKWVPEAAARYKDPYADMVPAALDVQGPDWAVYGREALKVMRRHVDWWINRQDERGELGSAIGDDTDMMPEVVNFSLIHDPGDRLKNGLRKLVDLCWKSTLTDGISTRLTDHLHAFEEGTNLLGPAALLFYGDPECVERLMITSRAYDTHLTAINPHGDRLFRSHYFSATAVRPDQHADTGWCLVMMPGRYLVWYNGSPRVLKTLAEWQMSFLKRVPQEPRRSFYGLPGRMSIDFPTGEMVPGRGPSAMDAHIYWLYRMTGDPRYVEPVLRNWRRGVSIVGVGRGQWVRWRKVMSDAKIDAWLRRKGKRKAGPYMAWKLGIGERSELIDVLKANILHMKKYLPLHTWVGQSADRVAIPQNLMATMYLGGMADKAKRLNYHYHAVSWEGADDDVSRFVVEDTPRNLKVLLYSFHEQAQDVVMRVWQLEHGRYRVRAGVDRSGDEVIDDVSVDEDVALMRYSPIRLKIPPRCVVVVTVQQRERLDDIRRRPDLAIGPNDVAFANGRMRVTIHNIGGAAAPATRVQLVRAGKAVAQEPAPPLAAPTDLVPKTATVTFEGIAERTGLAIRIMPPPGTAEITAVNNEITLR